MQTRHQAVSRSLGAVALMSLALGSGCLSVPIPQAEADPARFYVLSITTPAAGPGNAATGGTNVDGVARAPAVHLQPVEVASYLRARPMIVRRGANEIQFREFARWGESLDVGIARVLREELLARGAAREVAAGGFRVPGEDYDRVLSVRILACEGGADGSVLFHAVWELAPASGAGRANANANAKASSSASGETRRGIFRATELRWDGSSEASLAGQLSAAVAALAGEIAGALTE